MKTCRRCNQEKPATVEVFGKNTSAKDGLQVWCRQCQKEYRKANPEYHAEYNKSDKCKAAQAEYEKSNKGKARKAKYNKSDKCKAAQAEYEKSNKGKARKAEYQKSNKGKETNRNCNGRRRARIKENGTEHFTYEDLRMFWLGQNILDSRCYYCLKPFSGKPEHIDHYIPISQGGGHYKHNLRPSCSDCNLRKSDKHPIDFMKENNNG